MSLIAVFLLVLAVIIGAVVYVATNTKKEPAKEAVVTTIDDRISPNISQQLDVEVLRIRNRGLYDLMLQRGNGWKNPPKFYWIINVDGKEANSFGTVGTGSTGMFNTWDTMMLENRIPFRIVNEQPTSTVTVRIMQREYAGILGRKTVDIQEEIFNLTYDYRTGQWSGDDSFNDSDGYGHFLGKNYEIWFDCYQSDFDHDGIPYWTEVNVLHTDPTVDDSKLDPDHDGIPTSWEWKWGFNPFVADNFSILDPDFDGVSVLQEYKLSKWGANPFYPDIFIETDFMQKGNILDLPHVFYKESQEMLYELFSRHGITVHIDDGWPDGPVNGGGEYLPFIKSFEDVNGGQVLGFYLHNFADERKGSFRYVIIANRLGWTTSSTYNHDDTILIGSGLKSMYLTRAAFTPKYQRVCIAKCVLHELGHSMGLLPETFPGNDIKGPASVRWPSMPADVYDKYLKLYHSIMNYNYIWKDRHLVDFSLGQNGAPYDQNDWNHIYLATFNRDARSVEQTTDKSFEDRVVFNETTYPQVDGWVNATNMTKILSTKLHYTVYRNLGSSIYILVNPTAMGNSSWNVRVYARPNITPFPVIQSWTLVSEGHLNASSGKVLFYTIGQKPTS